MTTKTIYDLIPRTEQEEKHRFFKSECIGYAIRRGV